MLGFRGSATGHSGPNSQTLTPKTTPSTNSLTNGHLNGHPSKIALAHNSNAMSKSSYASQHETNSIGVSSYGQQRFTSDMQVNIMYQTVISTKAKLLAHMDGHYIDGMTVESFMDYINRERLTNMPQHGSRWDKVLKWAEFFSSQISLYQKAVSSFVPDSKGAAQLIWASCQALLELGHGNKEALETAFEVFYKIALSLSFFLRHDALLSLNGHIRSEVGHAFHDLLMLVRDVALQYHIQINTLTTTQVAIDFNALFGKHITAFYGRKDHIIDAMWACKPDVESANINSVRTWLGLHDSTVQSVLRYRATTTSRRDEYTCEWFQRTLLDFTRGDGEILAITGPSGCGKSFLFSWITERLQRQLGKKTHEILSVTIDPDLPQECTPLAIAKNLALQLLRTNIGDTELLNALQNAHGDSLRSADAVALESELWNSIHVGLRNIKAENLIVIIDGLDDRCGHQNAKSVSNRIGELASKHSRVKAIILARNAVHLPKVKTQVFPVNDDHTHSDLEHIATHALRECQHFLSHSDDDQRATIHKLTRAAKGDFLWIELVTKALKHETSRDGFVKAVKSAIESPQAVDRLLRTLISEVTGDFSKVESTQILSWLLVSERPLKIVEIKELLRVDIQKKIVVSRTTDIAEEIRSLCGPLVTLQNGIVGFRHGSIREQLLKTSAEGAKLAHLSTLQTEFVTRLLTYCGIRLINPTSSVFECPEMLDVAKDELLEYAARNWIQHFKKSSLIKKDKTLNLNADFKAAFPHSVQLVLLEWWYWKSQISALDAASLHHLALKVRQELFSEKNESVFQSLIICGHFSKKESKLLDAGDYFYRASCVGRSIFKTYSAVTISCTISFLGITRTEKSTSRTEVVTRKEELLVYLVSAYKQQYGKTSDLVIQYSKVLAELYVTIQEEHKAETIWEELQEIMITRFGKGSAEEVSIKSNLHFLLKKDTKHEEIVEYETSIFETVAEMEIWDVRRIEVTLKLAKGCESRGQLLKAEEYYVTLWRGLIDHCHHLHSHHIDIKVHLSMIDISLEYVRFLRRHHRHDEAAGVLICIWAEYEEYDFESEDIFLRLKIVGDLMRSVALLSIAVSVFKKCWSWFKTHAKTEHTESCQILISETVQEIITTTESKQVVSYSTTTTRTETIVQEMFESSIQKSTLTLETVSISQILISLYMRSEQWSQAIKISKRSLELMWRVAISGGSTIALPKEFGTEAIDIAIRLAICYGHCHYFQEAESIYCRVYQACFNSCQVHDERFTKAYTTLVQFYEEHGHWRKVIGIYKENLVAYRKHLGPNHALTIKTLYRLGSLCSEHGHGHPHEYYEEIITALNGNLEICHQDALLAMKIMCKSYFEEGSWQRLKHTCEVLWETWVHHHDDHKIEAEFIELLYFRYIYVLEHHTKVEYEIIRTITIQFRDTCIRVFGASVAVTVKALIELAQVCMRSEKHIHEAITYYEEVIKTTTISTTIISATLISTVMEQLTKAFIHVCAHGTASSTIIERAILVLTERFEYLKATLKCSHTETLTVLRELVLMYWKQSSKESHSIIVQMLLETTIAIISEEKDPRVLYEAAKAIGGIYLRCDLHEEGRKVLREMHRQVVSKTSMPVDKCYFKLGQSAGKGCFVFLVTFEEIIRGSASSSYSKIMADLVNETVLYDSYAHCVKSEKIDLLLSTGARLYVFLEKAGRKEQLVIIQDELCKAFVKNWASILKTRSEITNLFVVGLLKVLGNGTCHVHIRTAACKSSKNTVREFLIAGDFVKAYEVALCAFQFIEHLRAYHHLQNVGYGFKLSALLALRDADVIGKAINPELRTKMLDLSRKIINEVLKACKDSKINFVRLKPSDLNELVGLLGEQQNYSDLESLLDSLWASRDVLQRNHWSPEAITSIAKLLVQARFLSSNHHQNQAIRLCEAIYYNFRRVHGALDPKSLEMAELLSQLYTEVKRNEEAMRVHEEILSLVVAGDDDDDRTLDTIPATVAKKHLLLLKQTYLRLQAWGKKPRIYKELVDQLINMPAYKSDPTFKGVQSTDKWSLKEKPESIGTFSPPIRWEFADPIIFAEMAGDTMETPLPLGSTTRRQLEMRRVTSNWGMNIHTLGQSDDHGEKILSVHSDILVKAQEHKLDPKKTAQVILI